jgi:hypothetical protein
MKIAPFNVNDSTNFVLAAAKLQIKKIQASEKLSDEEKARQIALVKDVRKQLLVATDILREYSPLLGALNVCGGGEFSLSAIIPNAIEYLTPGLQGEVCATFAMSTDGGSGTLKMPTVGVSFIGGGQAQLPEKDKDGKPVNGLIEPQLIVSGMIPLTRKSPLSTVGDLQGYYVGGSLGWALETNSRFLENFKTGAFSPYVKVDGFKRPEVLMINITKTRTQQNRALRGQGEVFYYGTPWASDGTKLMLIMPKFAADYFGISTQNQHHLDNRLKRYSTPELNELLSNAEIQQMLQPDNVAELLEEAQAELKKQVPASRE